MSDAIYELIQTYPSDGTGMRKMAADLLAARAELENRHKVILGLTEDALRMTAALAAREADGGNAVELPSALVVTSEGSHHDYYAEGWNDCRRKVRELASRERAEKAWEVPTEFCPVCEGEFPLSEFTMVKLRHNVCGTVQTEWTEDRDQKAVAVPEGLNLSLEQVDGCVWALSALPQHAHVAKLRGELAAMLAATKTGAN